MSNKFSDILYQDKNYLIIENSTLKHSQVLMRPKVRVIIHDKEQNKILLLQDEWLENEDYGYFLPEENLYDDVQDNFDKTSEESSKDAQELAQNICKYNGIMPVNLKLFLHDFKGRMNCTYYYFLVTDFSELKVETLDKQNWFSISEILELIKNKKFYDEDVVGVLFTYFLQENEIMHNR